MNSEGFSSDFLFPFVAFFVIFVVNRLRLE
jgi:hypothetical protein